MIVKVRVEISLAVCIGQEKKKSKRGTTEKCYTYGAGGKQEESEREEEKQKRIGSQLSHRRGSTKRNQKGNQKQTENLKGSIEVGLQKRTYGGGVEIETGLQ